MPQPITTKAKKRSSGSYNDAGAADVESISHPCPTAGPERAGPGTLHLSRWFATASCMDLRQQSRHEQHRERLHYYNSSSDLQPSETKQTRPDSYTGPLARNQWSDVPLPYRPRDWQDGKDEPFPVTIQEPRRWRLRPSMNDGSHRPAESRGRRRLGTFRSVAARDYLQQQRPDADPALLYPQMSPYDGAQSFHSAPDELHPTPRAVSQPTTPGLWDTTHYVPSAVNEPSLTMIPRPPIYPASGRRRTREVAAHSAEATFTDEEEFHLFVQATAGLGPEQQAFKDLSSPDEPPRRSRTTGTRPLSTPQAPVSNDLVSPIQETPTTIYALQQLAQLPRDPRLPAPLRLASAPSFATQRLDTALGGIDLWLQPPSAVSEEEDDDGGVVSPVDDELPNYAASQAQVQAAQRAEATRRAQELQRRWHLRTE